MFRRLIRATVCLSNTRNPLFRLNVRRVRWFHSPKSLKDQSIRVFIFTFLVLFALWRLLPGDRSYPYGYETIRTLFVMGVMGLSVLAVGLLDVCAMLIVSGEQVSASRMDLIRLTALSEGDIVAAKHSFAQVRIWRLTMLIACARLTIILLTFSALFIGTSTGSFLEAFRYAPLEVIASLVSYGLFIVVFVLEPLWRVRAMTALGIAISTRVRNPALAILFGFLVIPAVWITQMVFLGIVSSAIFMATSFMFSINASLLCTVLYAGGLAVLVYSFYNGLQAWALHDAVRHTFQD